MKILARKAKEEGGRVPFLQRIQMSLERKEESKKAITAEIEDALTFQVCGKLGTVSVVNYLKKLSQQRLKTPSPARRAGP